MCPAWDGPEAQPHSIQAKRRRGPRSASQKGIEGREDGREGQGVDIKLAQELPWDSDPAATPRLSLHPLEVFNADVLAAMDERIGHSGSVAISTHRDDVSVREEIESLHGQA